MKILFRTVTGSRLYGLHHEGSDWDYYTVVDRVVKKKASYHTHSIVDGLDSNVLDFGTWVNECQAGTPQALEAMFSTKAEVDLIPEFRSQFRGGTNYKKYLSTMKALVLDNPDSFKHKRHSLRLAINLADLKSYGRFNPTLTERQIKFVNIMAENHSAEFLAEFSNRLAYTHLPVVD